jgi:16S rRNA (uracil1498-N3)-methyltransferase
VNPLLRSSQAHVFVSSFDDLALGADDEHHLGRVLRLAPTDVVTVSDGIGSWMTATWTPNGGLIATSEIRREPGRRVDSGAQREPITIGCAVPKGDRVELVVQKLTELGVERILLFETARSVVRWDEHKRKRQLVRLCRIAREASMQSRRLNLPVVEWAEFSQLTAQNGVAVAEPGGQTLLSKAVTTILIGPEGGFANDELSAAVPQIQLSELVLRVETAAIVAAALLVSLHN